MCSDIYRPLSFKLGMIVESTEPYILMSVWMTLTFIQGHSLLLLLLDSFCTVSAPGKEHIVGDLILYRFNIGVFRCLGMDFCETWYDDSNS